MSKEHIKLTQFSHGSGCGCKIAPNVLTEILKTETIYQPDPRLLVGNDTKDDAAVYDLDDQTVLISTTDFFTPIVDDPFYFGSIASVNAISDIYAMGGEPLMAISILGWPVDTLSPDIARTVVEGAREACHRAGITLAGGHSIDTPEPIFGLAVTGKADKKHVKTNDAARAGSELYLTKPLGIGILTTAQKQGILKERDFITARDLMMTLNKAGQAFSELGAVTAMTDVTGFGLLGHLIELCEGSNLYAEIEYQKVPRIRGLEPYLEKKTFPGGTTRNFKSYGHQVNELNDIQKAVLCDPQTSGGLLVAVDPAGRDAFERLCREHDLDLEPFGVLLPSGNKRVTVL